MNDDLRLTATDPKISGNWRWLVVISVILSLAYFVRVSVFHNTPVDFRYFWAAGRMWGEGIDPYGPGFTQIALDQYGMEAMLRWFYSPHTWLLARPLSLLSFEAGLLIWRLASVATILSSVVLLCSLVRFSNARGKAIFLAVTLLGTASSQASSITISIGQFSAFSFLAIALYVTALVTDRRWLLVPALILVTMKANLALPFIAFALAVPRLWGPLLVAGILSVVASIPAFVPSGVMATIENYINGMMAHSTIFVNDPPSMTGLRNLLIYWFDINLSSIAGTLLACIPAFLLGVFKSASLSPLPARQISLMLVASTMFFMPLHAYDLMPVVACIVALPALPIAILIGIGAILYRPNVWTDLLGIVELPGGSYGSYLISMVLLFLLLSAVAVCFRTIWIARRNRASEVTAG